MVRVGHFLFFLFAKFVKPRCLVDVKLGAEKDERSTAYQPVVLKMAGKRSSVGRFSDQDGDSKLRYIKMAEAGSTGRARSVSCMRFFDGIVFGRRCWQAFRIVRGVARASAKLR
ncbi:hypothetical protein TRVL_06898 [Trypanosoma vivax]|nr:hypothetical protein TRVL_06898 [Trypanosoma vivax]